MQMKKRSLYLTGIGPEFYINHNINETINCNLLLTVRVDTGEYHRSTSYLYRRQSD
jgi:hypothetical protein